jgi:hypothetical protein
MIKHSAQAAKNKAILSDILGVSNPSFGNIIVVLLFIIFLGWFTDSLFALFSYCLGSNKPIYTAEVWLGIIPFIILLSFMLVRWKFYQNKARMQTKIRAITPHEGVILFLSPIQDDLYQSLQQGNLTSMNNTPWKMVLLGLSKHRDTLKHVWVLVSKESSAQFKLFEEIFSAEFPDVEFHKVGGTQGLDFNHVAGLVENIEDIFDNLPKDIDEVEVVIDITGGFKTASIAGMMASLVSPLREIQYVQTIDPHDVLTYGFEVKNIGKTIKEQS